MVSLKISAQDFYISYNKTYSIDTVQIKEKSVKRMRDQLEKQALLTGKDSVFIKQLNDQINIYSTFLFASINENLKHKRKDIHIVKDSTFITNFFLKNNILEEKKELLGKLDINYKDESKLLKVWENRCNTKLIKGYECFEVKIVSINMIENAGFSDIKYWSLYVTDQIKISYHPIVNFKSILDKYYPLEIVEEEEMAKGFETTYTLKELIIK